MFLALVAIAMAPSGFSFSGGIVVGDGGFDPTHEGCVSCHGDHQFATTAEDPVTVVATDADGNILSGLYEHGATYTITITLDEQNGVGAANKAGFNLGTDGGVLEAGENSRIGDAGDATHTGPGFTEWSVLWTAPEEGAVTFRLYVNDVDGSGSPDAADEVYHRFFSFTDATENAPGAVEEHEPHVGVPLPQYWLGLIALGAMAVVIIFGYVYLKYASPHNATEKDR